MTFLRGLLPVLVALLAGCAATAERPAALLSADHPLAGRIWDVSGGRFIDRDALAARLARARFVLLGEKHDNPEHHRLQAWSVEALARAGRRPAVGFEMLTLDQADALRAFLARAPRDASGLGDAVDWKRSGWPEWTMYQPIADAALSAGLPIVAANLPRATTREIRRQGVAALDPALVVRVGLDQPLTPERRAGLEEEIRDSHCGYTLGDMLEGMVTVQRAVDGHMADVLAAAAADGDGAVLIAGSGHVREDWGVPIYLDRRAPGADVASVAFLEVNDRLREAPAYASHYGGRLPFDYVWFTPRLDDDDPCEKFKRALQHLEKPRP